MIQPADLISLIRLTLPDADVEVVDLTGTTDHYRVSVRSKAFTGKSRLDRHRLVETSVAEARADGRLHALEIRTNLI
ncbi:MAG TPA: BolA/IbaG family iron-sulfur metabolism protein [Candidatus Baltobacteraceae bacterium]|jgi:stress-induced morphogen|nr:BolA/IbaG family iron-sulfur metabolism protein [Candidatus Baltobacteraceae bacterium]